MKFLLSIFLNHLKFKLSFFHLFENLECEKRPSDVRYESAHFPIHVRNSVRGVRSRREGGTGVTAINSSPIECASPSAPLFPLEFSSRTVVEKTTRAISVNQIRRSVKEEQQRVADYLSRSGMNDWWPASKWFSFGFLTFNFQLKDDNNCTKKFN